MKLSLLMITIGLFVVGESCALKVTVESWKKKTVTIDANANDKISSLKVKIAGKLGIPVDEQRLTANSELLDDNLTLNDYPLAGNFLWLSNPLTEEMGGVYARADKAPKKKIVYMMVGAKDSIGQIAKAIEDVSGVPEKKMRLFFQGKEMSDLSKSAADYKLFQEAWIDVKERI